MKETLNYKLRKPDQEDFYNVDDFNYNADIIDTQLKANADAISQHLTEAAPHTYPDMGTDPEFQGHKYTLVVVNGQLYLKVVA